jgi:hypothetical protein
MACMFIFVNYILKGVCSLEGCFHYPFLYKLILIIFCVSKLYNKNETKHNEREHLHILCINYIYQLWLIWPHNLSKIFFSMKSIFDLLFSRIINYILFVLTALFIIFYHSGKSLNMQVGQNKIIDYKILFKWKPDHNNGLRMKMDITCYLLLWIKIVLFFLISIKNENYTFV